MSKALKSKIICLIVAAGSGERVASKTPKQYIKLSGKEIINHTVSVFLSHKDIDAARVVYNPKHQKFYDKALRCFNLLSPVKGGETRQESVLFGLESLEELNPEIVLIHDAARPFIDAQTITKLIKETKKHGAAIAATPVYDTLKKCEDDFITSTEDRQKFMLAATPQSFKYKEILAAHRKLKNKKFTDDAALYEHLKHKVKIVACPKNNFKITTAEDLQAAAKLMGNNMETRIGSGFDVHPFCPPHKLNDNQIMLCGVAVPHPKSLKGHSDADVGLHAIVDALLGAIGEGDIGKHFPPSDEQYRGADSSIFLKKAAELIAKKNGRIVNIDVTIICEKPRILEHTEKMRERIAKIVSIDKTRINVKATTTEKLGFTGREEGVAAQAVASVVL